MIGRIVLRVAAVDALALVEHELANDVSLALFELFFDELLDARAHFSAPSSAESVSASFFLSAE